MPYGLVFRGGQVSCTCQVHVRRQGCPIGHARPLPLSTVPDSALPERPWNIYVYAYQSTATIHLECRRLVQHAISAAACLTRDPHSHRSSHPPVIQGTVKAYLTCAASIATAQATRGAQVLEGRLTFAVCMDDGVGSQVCLDVRRAALCAIQTGLVVYQMDSKHVVFVSSAVVGHGDANTTEARGWAAWRLKQTTGAFRMRRAGTRRVERARRAGGQAVGIAAARNGSRLERSRAFQSQSMPWRMSPGHWTFRIRGSGNGGRLANRHGLAPGPTWLR